MIFPNRPVSPLELVAPVSSWDALFEVIGAGADAVYLDGPAVSRRSKPHSDAFNESDLPDIVDFVHHNGRRVYVYVAPRPGEDGALTDFLVYLSGLRVDAVEFEDMTVPVVVDDRALCLSLHARWAPAYPDSEMLPFLESMRVTRFRPSAQLPLNYYWNLHHLTGLALELPMHSPLIREHSLLDLSEAGIVGLRVEETGDGLERTVKACRAMLNRALEEQWLEHPDLRETSGDDGAISLRPVSRPTERLSV